MGKVYIEAQYRIKGLVYNHGYICIDRDSINCIFSMDCACIKIIKGSIHFYLKEYDPENGEYYETEEFIGGRNIDNLDYPRTYILHSNSNMILSLELIKRICDTTSISDIVKTFEKLFSK